MGSRYGWPIALSLAAVAAVSIPARPNAARQTRQEQRRTPDFDIRDTLPAAAPRGRPAARSADQRERVDRDSGSVRVLDRPGLAVDARSESLVIARWLASEAAALGLTASDLGSLALVRDYTSAPQGSVTCCCGRRSTASRFSTRRTPSTSLQTTRCSAWLTGR
jgi:hypothetical protein